MRLARILLSLPLLCANVASAATIATYDSVADSPYSLQSFNPDPNVPGPTVDPDEGNPGSYLRLTTTAGAQHTASIFDMTDPGTYPRAVFSFDFRNDLLGNGGADGFSFNFFDTAQWGASGPLLSQPFGVPEDPSAARVLGIGFDTWGNAPPIDYAPNFPTEQGPNYSEISVFYDNIPVIRIDDTRALPVGAFDLKDSAWHTVTGVVDFQAGTLTMSVDATPIFTDEPIPGLVPFESRIGFLGRTGGASERTSIDNVNVQFVPEPASAALVALGALALLRRRRF